MMTEHYEHPEERMQRKLLPLVQEYFAGYTVELSKGTELQNGFAVFYLIKDRNRVLKLRVSGETYLQIRVVRALILSAIEQMPA